ncbi:uncharacterized protein [Miscanthus floridulus]|uniref:uncharacterized protein n=1 Tax=Miscanthus floridulus TaxID=154761 RepID=UPI003457916F
MRGALPCRWLRRWIHDGRDVMAKGLGEPAGPAGEKRPLEPCSSSAPPVSMGSPRSPRRTSGPSSTTSPNLVAILEYLATVLTVRGAFAVKAAKEILPSNNFIDHERSQYFFSQIVDRLLTFTYSGGKAPAQARSVETPASEPGHGSGNSTPKDAPKAEPYRPAT